MEMGCGSCVGRVEIYLTGTQGWLIGACSHAGPGSVAHARGSHRPLSDSRCQPTVRASLPAIAGYLRTGHALVSLLVSFGYVLQRSARTTEDGQHRSQTLLACTGLSPTD